jgi:hypothetical protein
MVVTSIGECRWHIDHSREHSSGYTSLLLPPLHSTPQSLLHNALSTPLLPPSPSPLISLLALTVHAVFHQSHPHSDSVWILILVRPHHTQFWTGKVHTWLEIISGIVWRRKSSRSGWRRRVLQIEKQNFKGVEKVRSKQFFDFNSFPFHRRTICTKKAKIIRAVMSLQQIFLSLLCCTAEGH